MKRLIFVIMLSFISFALSAQELKQSICFENLFGPYIITFEKKADFAGDVVIIGFQYPGEEGENPGGIVIFAKTDKLWMPVYGAIFSKYVPKDIKIDGKILTIFLEQFSTVSNKKKIIMEYGKDFDFLSSNKMPFGELKPEASSLLKQEGIKASNVLDLNFDTAWAEGAEGTGIDESIVIRFKKVVNIGMVGVIPGLFGIPNFKDNNRVHRGKIKLQIEPPKSDEESNLLFSLSEEEVDMTFPNRPNCTFFDVRQTQVKELKIQITSVYLGDKDDDAYISEIFIFDFIDPEKYGSQDKSEIEKKESKIEEGKKEGDK